MTTAPATAGPAATARKPATMAQALGRALRDAMAEDRAVHVLGEDVGTLGGVFRITDGLTREFGEDRCTDTPLAEAGILGTAVGMAMYGLRPVVEMQFDAFAYPAFEQLVSQGIGDTIRVSLTVPNDRKYEEIEAGRKILADIAAGRVRTVVDFGRNTLNIISCPSCSRVENEAFVELAQDVKAMTAYAKEHAITIAVMGCRVNGPGETDDADLGLWCAPTFVNLKKGEQELGRFAYDEILPRLKTELDALIETKTAKA